MKVRKKPVVVDAWKLDYNNVLAAFEDLSKDIVPEWVAVAFGTRILYRTSWGDWELHTLEGITVAHDGDYIIKGVHEELYPIKREIFEETYEVLQE